MTPEELSRAFTEAAIAAAAHARAIDADTKAVDDYTAARTEATKQEEENTKKVSEAKKTLALALGGAAVDFTKAMVTGGEGTGKFSGSVNSAADAAGNAATALIGLGPLGIIVGGVIKMFGKLIGASLQQNDQLMKSYRELADVGSVSGSLEKLNADFHRVGLTTEDAAKFGETIRKVAPDLANFGGSVTSGKDKLLDVVSGMIGVSNKTEIAMGRLGYSADSMRDATAAYVAKQSGLGLTQGKTAEQLRVESVRYMVALRELGELTGMSRDEAQKAMQDQLADARFASHIRQMELAGQGKEAAQLQEYVSMVTKKSGKDVGTGLVDLIVNSGRPVTEAGMKVWRATSGQMYEDTMQAAKGTKSFEDAWKNTSKAVTKNYESLGTAVNLSATGLDNLTGGSALVNAAYAATSNQSKKGVTVAATLAEEQKKSGDLLAKNMNIEQVARETRIAADEALLQVTGYTVGALEMLTDTVHILGKAMAQFVDGLTQSSIGKKFGLTETHWSDAYRDLSDNAADMKTAAKEKATLVAEIDTLQKSIAAREAGDASILKESNSLKAQIREKEQGILDLQTKARNLTTQADRIENASKLDKERAALAALNQELRNVPKLDRPGSTAYLDQAKQSLLDQQKQLAVTEAKNAKLAQEKIKLDKMDKRANFEQPDGAAIVERIKEAADLKAQIADKEKLITAKQKEADSIKDAALKESKVAAIVKEQAALDELKKRATDTAANKAETADEIIRRRQSQLLTDQKKLALDQAEIQKLERENLSQPEEDDTKVRSGEATAKSGKGGASPMDAARSKAAQALPGLGAGRTEEILNKLNLKGGKGGQATAGGESDPALLAIAEKIQEAFPGSRFTSLNDAFHKKERPGSKHILGKALDFTLPENLAPKSAEESAGIKKALEGLGGSRVLDEYFNDKNENTKGQHFHVEVAKQGGAFSGPNAGYPVMLHGKQDKPESVWPEEKLKGLLAEVQKSSIEDYKREVLADMGLNKTSSPDAAPALQNNSDGIAKMMEMMSIKFDDMIAHLDTSNSTLSNLLTYAKA